MRKKTDIGIREDASPELFQEMILIKEKRYYVGKVKENLLLKGCHIKILSLIFICGSIAGIPAIYNWCIYEI